MANNPMGALVTILLPHGEDHRFATMLSALTRHLLHQGVTVEEIGLEGPGLATLRLGSLRLTAAWRTGPAPRTDYADYRRPARHCDPANDEAAVDRLAAHGCRLVLSCAQVAEDGDAAQATFRQVLSHLVGQDSEAIVLWARDRMLFTAEEFGRFAQNAPTLLARRPPHRPEPGAEEPDAGTGPVLLLPPPRVKVRRVARPRPAAAVPVEVANDRPDIPGLPEAELRRVRAALYPDVTDAPPAAARGAAGAAAPRPESEPTLAMRLSATAMDMTLLVVALPVGAAVVTHNLLRGRTDMRLSARMMALTGAFIAFSQSDIVTAMSAVL
ncbi:MAG: hypothetical protein KJZ85_11330 [Rhodobacteraceae bacterium]|nr:hypothetical protein [Paracoccaceae bacterium]